MLSKKTEIQNVKIIIPNNVKSPRKAFENLEPNTMIHGITNGDWSFIDALNELMNILGKSHITLSTWTAAIADISIAENMLKSNKILSWKMLVDRSFLSRQPRYCQTARKVFGDQAIRVWNCHAKFCVLDNQQQKILYLTSANLNKNKRVENFSLIANNSIAEQYLDMVNKIFAIQKPSEGFENTKSGRKHTDQIFND